MSSTAFERLLVDWHKFKSMDKEKELDDFYAELWDDVPDMKALGVDDDPDDEEGDEEGFFSDELRYNYRRIDDL